MYSDLAMLFLRFAQITAPDFSKNNDALNYYIGQFYYNNIGDWTAQFDKISEQSPFFLFAQLRKAEKSKDMRTLDKIMKNHPLFVPAANTLIGHYIKTDDRRAALRVVNRALRDKNINDSGRAFFLKSRAQIQFAFGNLNSAQRDLSEAADIAFPDAEILSLQAKIWALQNREIEEAYDYAMSLVKQNPSDVMAWDTLACVIQAREGVDAALEVLERVGEVSATCSSLFEQLGDLYSETEQIDKARDAYLRAIELSDDGLVVVPFIERKIRNLK
jgi:tetratricopeptide (TPR) repeat protein